MSGHEAVPCSKNYPDETRTSSITPVEPLSSYFFIAASSSPPPWPKNRGKRANGPGARKTILFSLFSSSLLFPFSSPSTTLLSPLLLLLFFLSKSEPDCSLDNRLQGPSCREGDPRKLRPAYDFLDFLRVQPLAIHLVVSYAKFQSSPGPFVGVILPVSRLFLRLRLSTLFLRRVNSDPAHAARRRVILDAAVSRPVLFGSG